ncbi:MAG: FAD-dependent oxidoreductase, partial [Bryobacteraceae bacterium]|nr:FAD-dependent oxidoreductase [Bryobacteraceae bacterium]
IAVIEWAFDPHGHHKYDPAHPGVREGYFYVDHEPFQVPYGVVVPRKIDGLLVPVACSCSHVAYNAVRMEPVFMVLGEACGIAAHLAIARKTEVRKAPVAQLQALLVERSGVVAFYEDLPFNDTDFAAFQYLGARGLNKGYRADKTKLLTRGDGAERLARILKFEGKQWTPPGGAKADALGAAELSRWLEQAGYRAAPLPGNAVQIDLAHFARAVYAAIRPRI